MEGLIRFHFKKHTHLPKREVLKDFLKKVVRREKYKLKEINYVICADSELLALNKKHLGHNYLTDILTFDLSSKSGVIEAEIYISADRIAANAVRFGEPRLKEFQRVMIHGILHLCGYNDKLPTDQKKMRDTEDFYLRRLSMFHVKQKS